MSRLLTRENVKLLIVAAAVLMVAWTGPAVAHGVHAKFAHNADKVDGKHAVSSGASLNKAKKKLVAHNKHGQLPAKFVPDSVSFPSQIPLGQSVQGRWGFEVPGSHTGFAGTSVNLPARAPTVPVVSVIQAGGASTADCPGTALNPKAGPGYLCVYVVARGLNYANANTLGANIYGTNVYFTGDGAGTAFAHGTYAYRAPLTAPASPRLSAPGGDRR